MPPGKLAIVVGGVLLGACTAGTEREPSDNEATSGHPTKGHAGDAAASGIDTPGAEGGCGLPVDGSRLTASRLLADDGSWQFEGWYDTELERRCAAATAADGVTRCLPGALLGIGYADSSCTQRALLDRRSACTRAAGEPLAYAGRIEQLECGNRISVYELGPSLGVAQAFYRIDPDGTCSPVPLDADADPNEDSVAPPELYEVRAEVAPERFVALEQALRGERLQSMRTQWADGAEYSAQIMFDTENETSCYVDTAADGETRCMPLFSGPSPYADAACTQRLLPAATCPSAWGFVGSRRYGVSEEAQFEGTCKVATLVHVFAASEDTRSVERLFYSSGAECVDGGDMLAGNYHLVGPEVDSTAFALLELTETDCGSYLKSGTRLGTVHWVDEHGQTLEGYFFDKELPSLCEFSAASDGVIRCLPLARSRALAYLDAECSREAAAIDTCDERTAYWKAVTPFTGAYASIARELPADCAPPTADIHPLIGPDVSVGYRRDNEGNCIQQDEPEFVYRELGPAIEPSAFVARRSSAL